MLIALLLQAAAIVLLRHLLGKTWLRRPVTLLVLASVIYQGVSPVVLLSPSIRQWDDFHNGIAQSYANEATLLLSATTLAFTVCYLLAKPGRGQVTGTGVDVPGLARALDWRILALCCAPLAALTYEGRSSNGGVGISPDASTGSVLASSFFVLLVALTAFGLVLAKGPRWFLPVLAGQSVIVAAAGERTPIIADAVVLIVLLCHAGMRPPARQLQGAAVMAVIAVLAITGLRSQQGRILSAQNATIGNRVRNLGAGLQDLRAQPGQGGPGLVAEAVGRLDGVDFTAGVLQSESFGRPRLSPIYVPGSLLIAVPSSLWPSKLAHGTAMNPVPAEVTDFGLQQINFLPGLAGMYTGFLAPPWLIAFMALLGVLAGWGERLLLRKLSPARFAMLASAVLAALSYEKGLQGMAVTLRDGCAVALAVAAIHAIRKGVFVRRLHSTATRSQLPALRPQPLPRRRHP